MPDAGGAPVTRRTRWIGWSVLALVYVVSYFHRTAPTVLAKSLMADFSATGAEVATMAALYLYVFAALQFVVGAVVDAWGPRRVVSGGALLMAAGAFLFSAARGLPVAYGARLVVGAGASVVFIGTLKYVAAWYRPDEFATLAGLTQ
ncbi:MAG TPA: MFS transporter, partial [Thermoanaerobaculia bacterium]|nr:MFS transporter [Thermoanaerobaculia bacterium]